MKKLKEIFSNIAFIFETIWALLVIVFGFPFYKKTLKEIWIAINEHKDENKY